MRSNAREQYRKANKSVLKELGQSNPSFQKSQFQSIIHTIRWMLNERTVVERAEIYDYFIWALREENARLKASPGGSLPSK